MHYVLILGKLVKNQWDVSVSTYLPCHIGITEEQIGHEFALGVFH